MGPAFEKNLDNFSAGRAAAYGDLRAKMQQMSDDLARARMGLDPQMRGLDDSARRDEHDGSRRRCKKVEGGPLGAPKGARAGYRM